MPAPPFIDAGNRLLAQADADLELGTVHGTGGQQRGVLTIRTATTTLTVMLTPATLRTWSRLIADLSASMSAGGLAVASADIPRIGRPDGG